MARALIGHALHRSLSFMRYRVLPQVGHEVMRHRSPNQIVHRWPEGEIPLGPRVCIYVHWDGAGDVRDHVLHHLRSLAAAGASIVFVTNAGRLRPAAMEAVKLVCAGVIVRRNVGYDFGAWREGIEQAALPRPNTAMVLIANDSVYGPVRPLHDLLSRIDFGAADVWACTESWQSRYHLQSYLMAFSPRVVASEAWRGFWASVRPTWAKVWLIRLYEVGLTQQLLKAGFACRAIWPYQDLVRDIDEDMLTDFKEGGPNLADPAVRSRQHHARWVRAHMVNRTPMNPTSDLWRQLLAAGFPFIKRELLRDNPTHVSDVADWRDVALEHHASDLAPIERDLQRTLKNRAP